MGVRFHAVGVNRMLIVNRNLWVGLEPWGENIGGEMLHLKSISFMVRAKYLYADVSFGINNFHKAKHR